MAYIKFLEMRVIEQVLWYGQRFVLSFSDKTFAEFFNDGLNIDIDDPKYVQLGTSKPIGSRAVSLRQSANEPLRKPWVVR